MSYTALTAGAVIVANYRSCDMNVGRVTAVHWKSLETLASCPKHQSPCEETGKHAEEND